MKVLHFKWHYLQICLCFVAVLFLAICGITFHLQTKAATADQPEELLYCSEKIDLPILMYHSILKDPKRADTYVLSPEQFETCLLYTSGFLIKEPAIKSAPTSVGSMASTNSP